MKDFFSQFFSPLHNLSSHITQRFNNPLGLAFLFSWVVINWQALYYFLFNDGSAENKIKYLLMMYKAENIDKGDLGILDSIIAWFKYTDNGTSLEHLLWSPLLAAILYVIFSPLLSNLVTGVWSILDKSCTSIRLKFVQGHTILTTDDKKKMYQALNEYEKDSQAKITELEDLVESLKNSKQIELALKREADELEKAKVDTAEKGKTEVQKAEVKNALKAMRERSGSDAVERAVADGKRRAIADDKLAIERAEAMAESADSDAEELAIAEAERKAMADEEMAIERAEAMAESADSDAEELAIAEAERKAIADEEMAIERAEAMAESADSDAEELAIAEAERKAMAYEEMAIERAEVMAESADSDAIERADKVKQIASHGTGRTGFDVILRAVADTADKSKKDRYPSIVKAGPRVLKSADDLSKASKRIVNSLNEDISHDNNDLNYYEHRTIVKKWFTVQAKQNKDLSELSEDEKDKIIHILAYLMTSGGAVSMKEMLRDISVSKVDFRQSINLLEAANIIYTSNVKVGINDKLLVDILAYSLQ